MHCQISQTSNQQLKYQTLLNRSKDRIETSLRITSNDLEMILQQIFDELRILEITLAKSKAPESF